MNTRKCLYLLLSLFFVSTIKALTPVASIVLSNPAVTNNITHYTVTDPNNEPYTIDTIVGGSQCIYIPNTKYAYFNVTDATIPSTQNNLIFYITYYDQGTGTLNLQYNGINNNNYEDVSITKTGTNTWITATVAITDASLRNAQNNNCDFRFDNNNYIREIDIAIGTLNPANETVPTTTGSSYSEFKGKSVAGYQAWFSTGNATSGWFHWSGTTPPGVGNLNFEIYPDVTEYGSSDLTQTNFTNLGDGSPSELFNSANTPVINTHFQWMKDNGIDGVALQRFINGIGSVINNSQAATPIKVKQAAEATGRIFYICYDISSTGLDSTWANIIKFDWVYNVEQSYALTASPAYATVNGKPVVEIWGTGFTGNHPGTPKQTIDLINFLKSRGCYVIGGLPTYWRTGINDSQAGFGAAYLTYNMISPWLTGRFGDTAGATSFKNSILIPDKAYCDQNGIDYMPDVFPGFSWSQWNNGAPNSIPRNAGDFFWQQVLNVKSAGIQSMYIGMFDEYDEGTAIMKAATDWTMIPTDQYFVTTSADGIWTSSDFYLRTAGAAIEVLKGTRPVTSTVPVPYSLGPIYYRNSFEKRQTNCIQTQYNGAFPIDPCFYKDSLITNSNITSGSVSIQNNTNYTKSGIYSVEATGTASSSNGANNYYYRISQTKIGVKANMALTFWKYPVNDLGRYTSVDLIFKSGKVLRNLTSYTDANGNTMSPTNGVGTVGQWQQISCQIGKGELVGDTIVGITIGYDHPNATGNYNAYFDDIVIEDAINTGTTNISTVTDGNNTQKVFVQNGTIYTVGFPLNSELSVYNTLGKEIAKYSSLSGEINLNLPTGVYIVSIKSNGTVYSQKVLFE